MGLNRLSGRDLGRLEQVLVRAAFEVLERYEITEFDDQSVICRRWFVTFREEPVCLVDIVGEPKWPGGRWQRSCTCSDWPSPAYSTRQLCPHLLAVIFKHPEFHYLLLDLFV